MFVICGTFAHSTDTEPLVILENFSIGVSDGKVCQIVPTQRRLK